MFSGALFGVVGLLAVGAAPPVAPKVPDRVGQIFIVGNEVTPQSLILDSLPLYPGQELLPADVPAAEVKLRWLRKLGIKATVKVMPNPLDPANPFKDILIRVTETPFASMVVGLPYKMQEYLLHHWLPVYMPCTYLLATGSFVIYWQRVKLWDAIAGR